MVDFPSFTKIDVKNYRLFPGSDGENGISFSFKSGVSVFAGVNGLGKTTLINILFRLVVGPFDLPKIENAAKFGSTARVKEIPWPARREYFSRRVADKAKEATARLEFEIGDDAYSVTRSLSDCRLLAASKNGAPIAGGDANEDQYKAAVVASAGFGSFIDFLTAVKFLTFFNEERRDILWDDQAQRQFFRILFTSPETSTAWVKLEAEIGTADSQARNASTFASRLENEVRQLESLLTNNAGVTAQLAAVQALLDAELLRQKELEETAFEKRTGVAELARQVERSKLSEDDARRELEELRYSALGRLFPKLDETAQYILTHLFANGDCLACGADAKAEIVRLERAIHVGTCAICGASPDKQVRPQQSDRVVPVHQVEQRKLDNARAALDTAKVEREAAETAEAIARMELIAVNGELDVLAKSIDQRRLENATLRTRLPPDPQQIADKKKNLEGARSYQREQEQTRAEAERKYQILLTQTEEQFRQAAVAVSPKFQILANAFLEETCALSFRLVEDRPSQSGARFMYPSLKFEMSAAAFETPQFRERPDDVSESQREFVDLAFRMALIETASNRQSATLVIETPEASLDAIFMRKAGTMLRRFAGHGRKIVVTSNLTSSVMLPSLLGEKTDDHNEIEERWSRVLNLLKVAAPNAAVRNFEAEYHTFLDNGVKGLVA